MSNTRLERCYHRCGICNRPYDHMVQPGAPLDDYSAPCDACRAAGRTVRTRRPRPVVPGGEEVASLPLNISRFLETGDRQCLAGVME